MTFLAKGIIGRIWITAMWREVAPVQICTDVVNHVSYDVDGWMDGGMRQV